MTGGGSCSIHRKPTAAENERERSISAVVHKVCDAYPLWVHLGRYRRVTSPLKGEKTPKLIGNIKPPRYLINLFIVSIFFLTKRHAIGKILLKAFK